MPDTPILQIACQAAAGVKVGNRVRQGVLIAASDITLLRRLSARDITIKLVSPGARPYHARIRALLSRAVPVPGEQYWYVPTTTTGPLKAPDSPEHR
jgi:hypothetical protein